MKLTAKLTLIMGVVCATTGILVGGVGGLTAIKSGESTLRQSVADRLVSLNDNRAREVTELLDRSQLHLEHMAADPNTSRMMQNLALGFDDLASSSTDSRRRDLQTYYRNEFEPAFEARNGASIDSTNLVQPLSTVAVALQARYILDNPHPVGAKEALNHSGASDSYDLYHSQYHPSLRAFLNTFGYYDLFLVEPENGQIVYSVYKETDFATSLVNGPYANSGLAEAYKGVIATDAVTFSRLNNYRPSYDDPALFLGAPVRANDGTLTGVLIFQIPMPQLDALLTANGDWSQLGLGESGETYLVNAEGGIVTDLRDRAHQADTFYASLTQGGMSPAALSAITGRDHPAGRLPEPTDAVLRDDSGLIQDKDVMGRDVIKAWRTVPLGASQTILVSQQSVAEALAPLGELRRGIILGVGLGTLLVCMVGALIGRLISHRIAQPVRLLADTVARIDSERDLTVRMNTSRNDEIGLISNALDGMLVRFRNLLSGVTTTAGEVGLAARQTADASEQNRQRVSQQQEETSQVAAAVTEMAASVQEVARNIQEVAEATRDAQGNCQTGGEQITELATRISELADQVRSSNDRIVALDADTRRVNEIVALIAQISEQTNLLALNAAIESARAGEHGRGFAVVADEVRALASRTREAADEVRGTMDRLQSATGEASLAMTEQQQRALSCVEAAEATGHSFQQINARVSRVSELTDQVSGAAEEQSQVAEDINRRLANIAELADESANTTRQVASNSSQLSNQADEMEKAARLFRT